MKTSKMDKQTVIALNNKELLFRKITIEDKDAVMDLFSNCEEFFILTEGAMPVDSDGLFYDLPPGKLAKEKYLYGIFEHSSLIAAADIVTNYPEEKEWMIGLLLIHPKSRGVGLGKIVHDIIKELAVNEGAEKLRVAVVEQNTKALIFWGKIGYKQIKVTEPIKFGIKESRVIVMNYFLTKSIES